MKRLERKLEPALIDWFFRGKVLVITGARQVGKTTMLSALMANESLTLWLNCDETQVRERLESLNINAYKSIIGNYKILVIDEVQRVKNAGLMLKLFADNFKSVQFIATGSSSLDIADSIFEPLTGRHLLFHLYPFSLSELYADKSPFQIEQELPFHLVYGSYPEVCNERADAELILKNLANQYLYKDVLAWKDIRKPGLLDKLLKLLAYQVGSEVSLHELGRQLNVKSQTVETYIDILEKSFVIFRITPYSNNPRKEVVKMSKIYFWDNGIRNSVIHQFSPIAARNDLGQLWENFMISERLKTNHYAKSDAKSYFWRSLNQSEVDYIEVDDDKIHAYEFKWGSQTKFSRAFLNFYPQAHTAIIQPQNFTDFCRV